MRLRIKAKSLFFQRFLEVGAGWVDYTDDGTRRFLLEDVECVLLSEKHVLSFQVGYQVFSIPTNPRNAVHQQTIASLVAQTAREAGLVQD